MVEPVVEPRDDLEIAGAEVALDQADRAYRSRAEHGGPCPPPVHAATPVTQSSWRERSDHLESPVLGLDEAGLA